MRDLLVAATIVVLAAMPSAAAVSVSSTDGAAPFGVPATFQFDTVTPEYSGAIYNDTVIHLRARPAGSTGGYAAVGPGLSGSSAVLDLTAFADIDSISFLWGSVDDFNTLDVLGTGVSFNGGSMGVAPPTGGQVSPNSNRLVTLTFSDADRANVTGLRFSSTHNAFEFDNVNVSVAAVPELASWTMMIAGFGAIGAAMRSRRQSPAALV